MHTSCIHILAAIVFIIGSHYPLFAGYNPLVAEIRFDDELRTEPADVADDAICPGQDFHVYIQFKHWDGEPDPEWTFELKIYRERFGPDALAWDIGPKPISPTVGTTADPHWHIESLTTDSSTSLGWYYAEAKGEDDESWFTSSDRLAIFSIDELSLSSVGQKSNDTDTTDPIHTGDHTLYVWDEFIPNPDPQAGGGFNIAFATIGATWTPDDVPANLVGPKILWKIDNNSGGPSTEWGDASGAFTAPIAKTWIEAQGSGREYVVTAGCDTDGSGDLGPTEGQRKVYLVVAGIDITNPDEDDVYLHGDIIEYESEVVPSTIPSNSITYYWTKTEGAGSYQSPRNLSTLSYLGKNEHEDYLLVDHLKMQVTATIDSLQSNPENRTIIEVYPRVASVDFKGLKKIRSRTAGDIADPEWTHNEPFWSIAAFKKSSSLTFTATMEVSLPLTNETEVQQLLADVPWNVTGDLDAKSQPFVWPANTETVEVENMTSDDTLPDHVYPYSGTTASKSVRYEWSYRTTETTSDYVIGPDLDDNTHTIYVTEGEPKKRAPTRHIWHSFVHQGCTEAEGKSGATPIWEAIFNDFTDQRVYPVRRVWGAHGPKDVYFPIEYIYWFNATEDDDGNADDCDNTPNDIVLLGHGRCGAFAHTLIAINAAIGNDVGQPHSIHGKAVPAPSTWNAAAWSALDSEVGSPAIQVEINRKHIFLVKNWTGATPGFMDPAGGVPAQGNDDPRSWFMDHEIVKYNSKIWDPSYGIGPYDSLDDYESNALQAHGILVHSTGTESNPISPGDETLRFYSLTEQGGTRQTTDVNPFPYGAPSHVLYR